MRAVLCLALMIPLASCSRPSGQADRIPDSAPRLRISVLKSGTILTEGRATALPDLARMLVDLKKTNGMVWYYREDGREEPPPQAMAVVKMIADHSLPVRLSGKPDFSDYIGEDGRSHPANE